MLISDPWLRIDRLSNKVTALILGGIVVLGGFLRIVYAVQNPEISRDGLAYCCQYGNWTDVATLGSRNAGMYWLFFLGRLFPGDSVFVVRCMNLAAGISVIGIAYGIAWVLWKKRSAALISALLVAVNYTLIRNCGQIQRESCYCLFFSIALGCIVLYGTDSLRRYPWQFFCLLVGGMSAALAMLFRFEALELGLIFLLSSLWLKKGTVRSWRTCLAEWSPFFLSWTFFLLLLLDDMDISRYFLRLWEKFQLLGIQG